MKELIVISTTLKDLPEKGEAVYVNKVGDTIRFFNGNLKENSPPIHSGDDTFSAA